MRGNVLYLDSNRSKAVLRALRRFGNADFASDINEALCFIADADCDYDYYFINADVPEARALIKHLRHDPDLSVPSAIVLLTENEDEDCSAWSADAYVNVDRIQEDIPYIFSHFKNEPAVPASVVRIASLEVEAGADFRRSATSGKDKENRPCVSTEESKKKVVRRESELIDFSGGRIDAVSQARFSLLKKPLIITVCLLLLTACIWLFSFGPLNGSRRRSSSGREGMVEAENTRQEGRSKRTQNRTELPFGYSSSAPPASAPAEVSERPVIPAQVIEAPEAVTEHQAASETPRRQAPPAPAPQTNHAPTVSISGPSLVTVGRTVTFFANASDPDGDTISYSWGGPSRSMAFQNTGSYPISVTVTDSKGLSASASFLVTVRQ